MTHPPRRVLLLGSYGQTNLGDDLLMYNYLAYLKQLGVQEVEVNASQSELIPQEITSAFPSLHIFETYHASPLQLTRTLLRVDAVVYGGGTIFKDLYQSTGRSKHSVVARIAAFNLIAFLLRKSVFNLNIGIGSIHTATGRLLTKLALACSKITLFRDLPSYRYARDQLHIAATKVKLSTDGLFIHERLAQDWQTVRLPHASSYRRIIGVNLLSAIPDHISREQYITQVAQALDRLMDGKTLLLFLPFQSDHNPDNDQTFIARDILPLLSRTDYYLPQSIGLSELKSYYQQVSFVIGMRFHCLLLATLYGVPFLALEYDPKCTRLLDAMDYEFRLPLAGLTKQQILDQAVAIQAADRTAIVTRLLSYTKSQYQQAEQSLEGLWRN